MWVIKKIMEEFKYKERNRLISKEMSNIYLKFTTEKK